MAMNVSVGAFFAFWCFQVTFAMSYTAGPAPRRPGRHDQRSWRYLMKSITGLSEVGNSDHAGILSRGGQNRKFEPLDYVIDLQRALSYLNLEGK
jgi:hypothetical protein